MNTSYPSNRTECSPEALSKRLFERPLKFAEIAELSEKCDLWDVGKRAAKRQNLPFTFAVPAVQLVASISRFVE
jgi:hypothetical protein